MHGSTGLKFQEDHSCLAGGSFSVSCFHFPNALLSLKICSVDSGLAFSFYFSRTRVNFSCSLALTQVQTHFQNLNKISRWLTKDEHWGLLILSKTTGNRSSCQPFSRQHLCIHLVNILASPLFQSSKLSKNYVS